jgi:hypothetical protein
MTGDTGYTTNFGGIDYYNAAAAGQGLVSDVTNPNSPLYTSDTPFQQSLAAVPTGNPLAGTTGMLLLIGLVGLAAVMFSSSSTKRGGSDVVRIG